MVAVESTMLPLGTPAPAFSLPDAVSGRVVSPADHAGQPMLVMFICNHCPFVVHVRDELTRFAADYGPRGLAIVAINANDLAKYPQDGPGPMKALAHELGWAFPYCFDDSQQVAQAYTASCTPDFFLFDADHRLFYRGQLDDSRPSLSTPVTGADLRAAANAALTGAAAPEPQKPSIGCNIKWRPGNAPSYFG